MHGPLAIQWLLQPWIESKQESTLFLTESLYVYVVIMKHVDMDDFLPLTDEPLTIPSTSSLRQDVCFNININGDVEQEDNESFTITVMTANSNDVIEGSNMAIITILDDDGMQKHSMIIHEGK